MKLKETKYKITSLIYKGLLHGKEEAYNALNNQLIYAITLYSSSGMEALGVAVNTEEALIKQNEKLKELGIECSEHYVQMNACEWDYFYSGGNYLAEACKVLREVRNYFAETNKDIESLNSYLYDSVEKALVQFKRDISADLLTGLQYSDPYGEDILNMERISQLVNSKNWHLKIKNVCEELA